MYQRDVPIPQLRPRDHDGGDPARGGDPDHGDQYSQSPPPGDRVMTATVEGCRLCLTSSQRLAGEPQRAGWLVKLVVFIIVDGLDHSQPGSIRQLLPHLGREAARPGWWTSCSTRSLTECTLANYRSVLTSGGLFEAFINSLIVTIPSTIIPITLAAFAAYGFAWTRFKGRSFLFGVVVGLLVVPLQISLVPLLQVYQAADLTGSFLGIWLAHTGFGLPLAIFCSTTTSPSFPRTFSSRLTSTGHRRSPHSHASSCHSRSRRWPPSPSSSFSGCGTTSSLSLVFLGTQPTWPSSPSSSPHRGESRARRAISSPRAPSSRCSFPWSCSSLLQRYFVRGLLAGSVKG